MVNFLQKKIGGYLNLNRNITYKHICAEDTYMFNYTQLPDELFTVDEFSTLSLQAKVLYAFMLRRVSLSKENKWIDANGDVFIYFKTDEIMQKFTCSNKTAGKIIQELEEIGLIEKKRQGQGKPDLIYVNKFSVALSQEEEEPDLIIDTPKAENSDTLDTHFSEVKNIHFKKCKNYTSKNEKNTLQEVKKVHTNYKKNSYKDKSISSSTQKANEYMDRVRLLEEEKDTLKQRINYQQAVFDYSAAVATAVFDELLKQDKDYVDSFTSAMFLRTCKAITSSREPILDLPGFINWCFKHGMFMNKSKSSGADSFNRMIHRNYDFSALENDIVSN